MPYLKLDGEDYLKFMKSRILLLQTYELFHVVTWGHVDMFYVDMFMVSKWIVNPKPMLQPPNHS